MWESRFLETRPRARSGWRAQGLASAIAGVTTLTLLNEGARRVWAGAPRIEILGERAARRIARRAGFRPGRRDAYWLALAGSLLADGAYFALSGLAARRGRTAGAMLGALAGAGAVLLPGALGLGTRPTRRTAGTALATVAWYVAGGVVAGAAGSAWARRRERRIARGR